MQQFQPNAQQPFQPNAQQHFQLNTQQHFQPNTQQYQYPPNTQPPYPPSTQQFNEPEHQHSLTDAQMRHYFFKPSKIHMRLIIVGILVFFIGILLGGLGGSGGSTTPTDSTGSTTFTGSTTPTGPATQNPLASVPTFFIIAGLGIFAIGGVPLAIYYAQRPTSEQYEQWITARSQPLYTVALQRLHLDESQCERIIEVQGGISSLLQLTKKFPEKEIIMKRLPNGQRHYSINVCTYIFLTKDDLAIYSGYINALSQNERFEDADRYYYQDIVAVSTSGPIYTYGSGSSAKEIQMQGFLIRAANGDVVGTDYATRIAVRNGGKREQVRGADEVVPALLYLLRDHKVSTIEASTISASLR